MMFCLFHNWPKLQSFLKWILLSICFESSVLPPLSELKRHFNQCEQRCLSMALMIQDSDYIGYQYLLGFFARNYSCSGTARTFHCCLPFKLQSLSHSGKRVLSILIAQRDLIISFLQVLHWQLEFCIHWKWSQQIMNVMSKITLKSKKNPWCS